VRSCAVDLDICGGTKFASYGGRGTPQPKKLGHRPNWSYESQPHIMCIRGPTVSSAVTLNNGLHVMGKKKSPILIKRRIG
jgi:hypothetical protein